jgi:polar amino acid transport system substrate-binding protein
MSPAHRTRRPASALRLRTVVATFVAFAAALFGSPTTVARGQSDDDALARIRKTGSLRYGIDTSGAAPFSFLDPADPDRLVGFEIEIVDELARRLGVVATPVRGDWAALIDAMLGGRCDIVLNGVERTPERARVVAFTADYYTYAQQWTVRVADRERLRDLATIAAAPEARIGVLGGSASVDVLRDAGIASHRIVAYDDSIAPYAELQLGRVDAVLAESIIAAYYCGRSTTLHNVEPTFAPGVYAACLRPNDATLRIALDEHLAAMKADGTLGRILQRWGLWSDRQPSLGIERGPVTERIALSVGDTGERDATTVVGFLARATVTTLLLTVLSMPIAFVGGLFLALWMRSRRAVLRVPAWCYVQVVRGTPLLVQIFFVYYTLPQLGVALGAAEWLTFDPFLVGVLCLAGNYAAYEAEIHRAGIDAVPRGQWEAAAALGMSERTALRRVVLPQSFKIILPPVWNDVIAMLKDSSLVSVIGVPELMNAALNLGKSRFSVPEFLALAAGVYLVLSLLADRLGKVLEGRMRRGPAAMVAR